MQGPGCDEKKAATGYGLFAEDNVPLRLAQEKADGRVEPQRLLRQRVEDRVGAGTAPYAGGVAFPADRPVTIRVSGTDWAPGGWDLEQTLALAQALEARGCSGIHVSSGGLTPAQKIPLGPSYQVPLARAVKAATAMPVVAVGLITDFEQAEAIVGTGDADLIALARAILYDPRWPWHAAAHFGASVGAPHQYLRSQPLRLKNLLVPAGSK